MKECHTESRDREIRMERKAFRIATSLGTAKGETVNHAHTHIRRDTISELSSEISNSCARER